LWPLQQSQVSVYRLANPTVLRVLIQKLPSLQIKVHRAPSSCQMNFNLLNTELNPSCHLLALLGAHHILHVSRIRIKFLSYTSWHSSHLPTYQDRLHLSQYIQQKRMSHTFFPQILYRKCSHVGFQTPIYRCCGGTLLQTFKYGFNTVHQCSIMVS
jgi:hypothetical protein